MRVFWDHASEGIGVNFAPAAFLADGSVVGPATADAAPAPGSLRLVPDCRHFAVLVCLFKLFALDGHRDSRGFEPAARVFVLGAEAASIFLEDFTHS